MMLYRKHADIGVVRLPDAVGQAEIWTEAPAAQHAPQPVPHPAIPVGGRSKRALDLALALAALLALSPLLICIALMILVTQGRPVLISHQRVGYRGEPFGCLKFRSMVNEAPAVLEAHLQANPDAAREWHETRKLRDDPRVTPLGHVIRRLSIDELPQLMNVVRGDMSIVGPRPVVTAELERYGAAVAEYMKVRPGLTGAWQISGRSDVSYQARVELDADYVRTWSMSRDVMIMARTVPIVLSAKGSC